MSVNVYDPVNDTLTPIAGATLYADVAVGFIGAFDAEEVPDGWLIFNGQTKNRADYPDLWARANRNGQVGVGKFYGIGDGSTTFTLADLRETSLKGYGETSRSVGSHVKSGGLAVGEFIDDRLQNHEHEGKQTEGTGGANVSRIIGTSGSPYSGSGEVFNARTGLTTEVKAVGVVWAVKARQTGLPIDLKAEVLKELSSKLEAKELTNITVAYGYGKAWRSGNTVTVAWSTRNDASVSIPAAASTLISGLPAPKVEDLAYWNGGNPYAPMYNPGGNGVIAPDVTANVTRDGYLVVYNGTGAPVSGVYRGFYITYLTSDS